MAGEYLSVKEVARRYDISENMVLEHAEEWGGLKVGRLWRFPSDIDKRLRTVQTGGLPKESPCPPNAKAAPSGRSKSEEYARVLEP